MADGVGPATTEPEVGPYTPPLALTAPFGYLCGTAGCLAWDTVVHYNRGNRPGGRPCTLSTFYEKFNGLTSTHAWRDLSLPTFLHSLGDDGVMFYNRVVAVLSSGVKEIVRVQFDDGTTVRATLDHPILTTGGFVCAGALTGDMRVLARGTMKAQGSGGRDLSARPPRVIVNLKYHPFGSYKLVDQRYEYTRVARARLIVEAALNNLSYAEFVHILKSNATVAGQLRYLSPELEVHHIDEDTLNDDIGNLQVLSKAEHARLHNQQGNFAFDSVRELTVLSITKAGPCETYDIQMESPANNFCANGVVVHNTGKTFLCRRHVQEVKGTTLCATTGIAAVNLGGDVTTINALLGYFNTESLEEQYTTGRLASKLRKLRMAGVRRLVLDEVSMMHAEQLTYLVRAIEEVNGSRYQLEQLDEEDAEKLAGREELSLTMVGDFAQLGPIDDKDDKGKKRPAKYAFESPEWHRFEAGTTQLTEIRRQSDRAFIEALQAVRRGDRDVATAFFAPYLHQTQDREYPGPLIVAKNDEVERWNQLRLDELTTPIVTVASSRWGDQRPEWKDIPETLVLKPGALVMVLANYRPIAGAPYDYVNGDTAIFNEIDTHGSVCVTLQRTGREIVVNRVVREKKIPLEPGRRKELKAEGKEHLIKEKWEITGAIDYLPLRLAYASTVHRSQGLSFDYVQVNIASHFFSTGGMLYVALSRARTLEGLRLVGSAEGFRARCTRNEKVARWL